MKLTRYYSGEDCTLGVLTDGKFFLYTLENPWLDNQKHISCIPDGTYTVVPHSGFKHKNVWRLQGVDGRYTILIHVGNYVSETKGCILIGLGVVTNRGEKIITHSRDAKELLHKHGGLDTLTIQTIIKD